MEELSASGWALHSGLLREKIFPDDEIFIVRVYIGVYGRQILTKKLILWPLKYTGPACQLRRRELLRGGSTAVVGAVRLWMPVHRRRLIVRLEGRDSSWNSSSIILRGWAPSDADPSLIPCCRARTAGGHFCLYFSIV